MSNALYLDYAATTPTDQRVVDAMLPYFVNKFGNPASRTHDYGQEALDAVKQSRSNVAKLIGAELPEEIIFTSGATEAINLAIKGAFEHYKDKGDHIITVVTEHKAVLDTCAYVEQRGGRVTYLPVDRNGLIDLDVLRQTITPNTILVCVMMVNNETGVIQPIRDIARIVHEHDTLFMTDATQALGKISVDVQRDDIDILCCSAHKLYGPNGVGALYVKNQYPRIRLTTQMHGGGHENGFRSGTLNTPAIVGFGEAALITVKEIEGEAERIKDLSEKISAKLKNLPNFHLHAEEVLRAPNILNFYFEGIEAEALIMMLRTKLALANGSACTSREVLPSHVIMAMYNDRDIAYCSLRLSIGRFTQEDAADVIYEAFEEALQEIANYY